MKSARIKICYTNQGLYNNLYYFLLYNSCILDPCELCHVTHWLFLSFKKKKLASEAVCTKAKRSTLFFSRHYIFTFFGTQSIYSRNKVYNPKGSEHTEVACHRDRCNRSVVFFYPFFFPRAKKLQSDFEKKHTNVNEVRFGKKRFEL